jgi:hypothetical protein
MMVMPAFYVFSAWVLFAEAIWDPTGGPRVDAYMASGVAVFLLLVACSIGWLVLGNPLVSS